MKDLIRPYTNSLFFGLLLLSVFIIFILNSYFQLQFEDLSLPLKDSYIKTDARMMLGYYKMIVSGEWSVFGTPMSAYLSAPFTFEGFDFPLPFFMTEVYIKGLGLIFGDTIVVYNIFYLSTYFLNAFTMFIVLKKLKVNFYLSLSLALVFTFLPRHYLHLGHIMYSGYFFIPIWIYYTLLLAKRKPLFFKKNTISNKYEVDLSKRNICIAIVLLISSTWNFYYTFFFSFILLFVGILNFFYKKSKFHIYSIILVLTFVTGPFIINMVPYKLSEIENGKNMAIAKRHPIEAEVYGLKIISLVLPVEEHNNEKLAQLKKKYLDSFDTYYENNDISLGAITSLGLFILIILGLLNYKSSYTVMILSKVNLFAILLTSVGGFGVVFSYLITSQIRGYNRISVFIAAFSLILLAIIFNKYLKYSNLKSIIVSIAILIFTIWDQVPKSFDLGIRDVAKSTFFSDKEYVKKIEELLSSSDKKMVAQFPFIAYPESGGKYLMQDYEHIFGYIHSGSIHWSYGAIKGRISGSWWKALEEKKLNKQIEVLKNAGFSGISINKSGYKDNGEYIISNLENILKVKPIVSPNNQKVFFKLSPTADTLGLIVDFNNFYDWEGAPGEFRWAQKDARIRFYNLDKGKKRTVKLEFDIGTLADREIIVKYNNRTIDSFKLLAGQKKPCEYILNTNLDKNEIRFFSDIPPTSPPSPDTRTLLFSISNYKYQKLN